MAFHLPVLNDHPDPLSDERIEAMRPRTYGDCLREGWGYEGGGERPRTPCPWLGCKHHLAWFAAGSLEAIEQVDIEQMKHTCTLRVAEEDGVSLDEVGQIVGVSRERIRQIQSKVLQHLWPRRGSVIETLVLEGHEISRPDLRPTSDYESGDMVKQIRKLAGSERTAHGTWKLKNTEFFKSKNPVRVLTGAEREARIEELRARGKPSKSNAQERPMPTSENKQSGAELLQVIREFSNAHNMPMSTAASKLGVSSSMLKRIEAGRSCMTATVEKARAAATAFVPSTGRRRRSTKPSPAAVRPTPALVTPAFEPRTPLITPVPNPLPGNVITRVIGADGAVLYDDPQRNPSIADDALDEPADDEAPAPSPDYSGLWTPTDSPPASLPLTAPRAAPAASKLPPAERIADMLETASAIASVVAHVIDVKCAANVIANLSDAKRAASVIERLGGLDRAERIAAAIAEK